MNGSAKALPERGRLVELASTLRAQAEHIEWYLARQELPSLSFDSDTPDDLPPELHTTRHTLLEAADELVALVQGPRLLLATFAEEHNRASSIHAIIRFELASAFPFGSIITFADLASKTSLSEEVVIQMLRHAMTYRVFCEPSPGIVAHTAASRLLASSPNLRSFIEIACDELLPSASRMVDAMQRWPGSQEPHEAGFNLANDTTDPMFAVMNNNLERAERFARSMKGFLESPAFSPRHLVEGYEWSRVKKVVDIGGSGGAVATALAKHFKGLDCVVQDLPHAIKTDTIPDDLKDRVALVAHDMFEEQSILDADIYLLRFVLHDWSDKYAAKVLKHLVPALEHAGGSGRRVLINDTCLPDWGTMSIFDQRFLRATSLTMREIQNGKERDVQDWKNLLRLADPRLVLKEVRRPEGSALSILVVELDTSSAQHILPG